MSKPVFIVRSFLTLTTLICVFIGVFVPGQQTTAAVGINRQLNYQAKLLTSLSVPVPDGAYSVKFSIYDSLSSGNRLWTAAGTTSTPSAVSVTVTSGLFTVQLGDVSAGQNPLDLDWNTDSLYLGVTIAADSEMTPRKRLTAVPYAFMAESLQGQYASSSVTSTGGNLFALHQLSTDAATNDRASLAIYTSGTSNLFDYLLKANSGADVFTISREGHTTTTGNLATNGNLRVGDATSDVAIFTARVGSSLVPAANGAYDLGSPQQSWANIYASGTGFLQNVSFVNATGSYVTTTGFAASLVSSTRYISGLGSSTFPAFTFSGDEDTGILSTGAGKIDFATDGNISRLEIQTTQIIFGASLTASSNNAYDIGTGAASFKDFYASGTAYVGTDVKVGGNSVCLVTGVNCPASASTDFNWTYSAASDFVRNATATTDIVLGSSATSTGAAAYFDLNGGQNGTSTFYFGHATNANIVLGGTSTTIGYLNSLFVLDGNDLFASGNIGAASSVYTNGAFIAGAASTYYGDGFVNKTNGTLAVMSSANILLNPTSNVGIGTSTPDVKLTIARAGESIFHLQNTLTGSGGDWYEAIGSGSQFTSGRLVISQGVPTASNYEIQFEGGGIMSARTALAAPSFNSLITGVGTVNIMKWTNTGGNFNGYISLGATHLNAGTGGSDARLYMGSSSASRVDIRDWLDNVYLTVKRGGNVGIGTISPTTTLEVAGMVSSTSISTGLLIPNVNNLFTLGAATQSWSNVYASGSLFIGSGSVASPAINFGGTNNSGWYGCGSGCIALSFNGVGPYAVWAPNGNGLQTGLNITDGTNNTHDLGKFGGAFHDIYASGTVRVSTDVVVGGSSVCLESGTNCPNSSSDFVYTATGDFLHTSTATTDLVLGSFVTSTGAGAYFDLSGAQNGTSTFYFGHATNANIVLGGTSTTVGFMNPLFKVDGDDLFVSGNIGAASSVYTNGSFVAGAGSTHYSDGLISKTNGDLTLLSSGDMYLNPTGNIGISTTTLTAKLNINGSLNVGGSINGLYLIGLTDGVYTTNYQIDNLGTNVPSYTLQAASQNILALYGSGVSSTGNIEPTVDATDLLGSATKRYLGLNAVNVTATNAFITNLTTQGFTVSTTAPTVLRTIKNSARISTPTGYPAISGRYAYVPTSNSFTIFDIADPSSATSVSVTSVTGVKSVAVAGRYAYLTGGSSFGLKIYDVSQVTLPVLLATGGSASGDDGIAISGRYAYIAAPTATALKVYDVASSTSPKLVGTFTSSTGYATAAGVAVQGSYAYMTSGGQFSVLDVTIPTAPTSSGVVRDTTNLATSKYLAVRGAYAYVPSANRFNVIDISSATAPRIVATVTDTTNLAGITQVALAGSVAYVTASTNDKVVAFDISDPTNPRSLGVLTDSTNLDAATGIVVSGRNAYVTVGTGATTNAFTILSLSGMTMDSANIGSLSVGSLFTGESVDIGGGLSVRGGVEINGGGLSVSGNLAVQGEATSTFGGKIDSYNGIQVSRGAVDVIPSDPFGAFVASSTSGAGQEDQAIRDNYLYVADKNNSRIWEYDITNLASFRAVATLTDTTRLNGALGAAMNGPYLYTLAPNNATGNDRLTVIDTTDPVTLSFVTSVRIADAPRHVAIQGKYAYVIHASTAGPHVTIYDISSSTRPALIRSISDSGKLDTGLNAMTISGNRLYVHGSNGKFSIVDITNPYTATATTFVASSGGTINGLVARGRYVFRVVNGAAIHAVDVSSTTAAPVVSTCIASTVGPITSAGKYLYSQSAGSGTSIMYVFDVSNPPTGCTLVGSKPLAGFSSSFHLLIRGNTLFIGEDNREGMVTLTGTDLPVANIGSLYGGNATFSDSITAQGNIQTYGGINAAGGIITNDGFAAQGLVTSSFAGTLLVGSRLESEFGGDGPFVINASSTCSTCGSAGTLQLRTNSGDVAINPGGTIAGSNIVLGESTLAVDAGAQDTVLFYANVGSNVIPRSDDTFAIGTTSSRWLGYFSFATSSGFFARPQSPLKPDTSSTAFYSDGITSSDNSSFTIMASGSSAGINDTLGYLRLQTLAGSIKLDPNINGQGIVRLGNSGDKDFVLASGDILPTVDDAFSIGTSSTGRWRGFLSYATATRVDVIDEASTTAAFGTGNFLKGWYGAAQNAYGVVGYVTSAAGFTVSDIPANTFILDNVNGDAGLESAAGYFVNGSQGGSGAVNAALVVEDYSSTTQSAGAYFERKCGSSISCIIAQFGTNTNARAVTIRGNGQLFADTGTVGTLADYAELFPTSDTSITVGEIVAMDATTATSVKRAMATDRDRVLGVISAKPLITGNAGQDGIRLQDPNFKIVGLLGQLPVRSSDVNGEIHAGDNLMAGDNGYAVKASGVGMIIGRAMVDLTTATGTVMAYIDPQWSADGVLQAIASSTNILPLGTADATTTAYDSFGLAFSGSVWDASSSSAVASTFTMQNDVISASSSLFTIRNGSGNSLLTISDVGDLSVTGDLTVGRRLYLGSKTTGAGSTSTYLFVDDTQAPTSTYIATNADGWSTATTYDYAERFHSSSTLEAGDLVAADSGGKDLVRRVTSKNDIVLGIVSTKPGFITGAYASGTFPIALAGRVPTRVSTANGAILPGDQLAPSDVAGVAVKAIESGPIVGIALEAYDAPAEGKISVFVQPGWRGGQVVQTDTSPASITYQTTATPVVSPRSGLAKIAAGATEVNVSFASLNSYPLVTVTPYGQTTKGWWLTNVNDHGFTIQLGEAPMFDLVFAWKAEPSPDGSTMSLSDGTSVPYDPTSGQTVGSASPTPTSTSSTTATTATETSTTSTTDTSSTTTSAP